MIRNLRNTDHLYDAVLNLKQQTKLQVSIESNRKEYDAILTIGDYQFIVEYKSEIRLSNKGIVLSQLDELHNRSRKPIIIIAKYITADICEEFKERNINYIDIAGNCYINHKSLFIYIIGKKTQRLSKTNKSRAFQEAGIKLIFNLLKSPESLQYSYRKLAEITDISIGSVSNVMKELEELKFVLKTNKKRVLKNTSKLLDRWVIAYNDVLRPRILKKRMRFINIENLYNWDRLPIQDAEDVNLWGGEPAAAILTGQLHPEKLTIYTNGSWQGVASDLKMVPDENGEIEILYIFWKEEDKYREEYVTPALLVYTDLISSGYERNIQIANEILNNELQYIK